MPDASFRRATAADLPAIVALLADDPLGAAREAPGPPLHPGYRAAFDAIAADPNQVLLVAEEGGAVVGTLQVTIIPYLSRKGSRRGMVEAVRVAAARRGAGIGAAMMRRAVALCRERGCGMVQLTTDASRTDAHRFYERLGFARSHHGYKLAL